MDVDMGSDMNGKPYVVTGADFAARGNMGRDSWADSRRDPRDQMRDPRDRDMRDPHDMRDPRDPRDPRDSRDSYGRDMAPSSGPVPPQGSYDRTGVPMPPGNGYPGFVRMNPGSGPGPVAGTRPGDYMQHHHQQQPPGAFVDTYDGMPHDPLYGRGPYQEKPGYPAARMSNPRAAAELASPPGKGSTTPTMDSHQDFDPSDPVARRSAQSPNVNITPTGTRRSEERNLRDRDSDRGSVRRPPPPQSRH
jgi:hypothetical protein